MNPVEYLTRMFKSENSTGRNVFKARNYYKQNLKDKSKILLFLNVFIIFKKMKN